uniref:Uncharacterized protein n=1 Tax=Anguilla anguilla TaxID=7936 RepID=A0A0E9PBD8_ANGAN
MLCTAAADRVFDVAILGKLKVWPATPNISHSSTGHWLTQAGC